MHGHCAAQWVGLGAARQQADQSTVDLDHAAAVTAGVLGADAVFTVGVVDAADGVVGQLGAADVVRVDDSEHRRVAVKGCNGLRERAWRVLQLDRRGQFQDRGVALGVALEQARLDVAFDAVDQPDEDRLAIQQILEGMADGEDVLGTEHEPGAEEVAPIAAPPQADDQRRWGHGYWDHGHWGQGFRRPCATWR